MIYLVEDDKNLQSVLRAYLEKEGFEIKSFTDGGDAQKSVENEPDMWILDIGLPNVDGYSLLKEIKANNPKTPVIFISARDRDIDRVIGLEIGAEDYITKPFLPRELVIRVKNIIERNKDTETEIDGINLNINSRKAFYEGEEIPLTGKEFDLLQYLFENPNTALSREMIMDKVWGDDYFGSDRSVDDLIRRLRKKIPSLPLETLYGYGYRINR